MTPDEERVVKQMEWAKDDYRIRLATRLLEEIRPASTDEAEALREARAKVQYLMLIIDTRK